MSKFILLELKRRKRHMVYGFIFITGLLAVALTVNSDSQDFLVPIQIAATAIVFSLLILSYIDTVKSVRQVYFRTGSDIFYLNQKKRKQKINALIITLSLPFLFIDIFDFFIVKPLINLEAFKSSIDLLITFKTPYLLLAFYSVLTNIFFVLTVFTAAALVFQFFKHVRLKKLLFLGTFSSIYGIQLFISSMLRTAFPEAKEIMELKAALPIPYSAINIIALHKALKHDILSFYKVCLIETLFTVLLGILFYSLVRKTVEQTRNIIYYK